MIYIRIFLFIKLVKIVNEHMAQELQPHILRKFQILQKLGKGAYGVVWKAVDKVTKQIVALKKVFDAFQNATDAQRTYRQVIFLQQLYGHPNIVSLLSIIKAQSPKDIYLVFDFMQTDLHAVIRANIMQNVHKKYVMYQVLKGIKYMHSGELIHRDLKPSNILLDSDCLAKLADFGLARSVATVNQSVVEPIMTEYVATRWYRAPEILLGSSKYTKAVDMWSVGCILGELYVGKAIFPGNSTLNQVERIIELLGKPTKDQIDSMESVMAKQCLNQINFVKKKSFSSFFQNMDQLGLDLLRKLLVFNPKKRLTVQQALEHPYLQDFHQQSQELTYNGVIEIAIDQNTKYSIKQYRDALYRQVNKQKSIQQKPSQVPCQVMNVISQNQLKKRERQRYQKQQRERDERQKHQQRLKHQQNQRLAQKQREKQILKQRRLVQQSQKQKPRTSMPTRQPYPKKKQSSLSKQNYYYHSSSQHNSSNPNNHNQSTEKSMWMRSQKGKSFYGDKYQKYQKEKGLDRTYTQVQNQRRK